MTILELAPDVPELDYEISQEIKCEECSNVLNVFQVMNRNELLKDYLTISSNYWGGYNSFSDDVFDDFIIKLERAQIQELTEVYSVSDGFNRSKISDIREYYYRNNYFGNWREIHEGWIFYPTIKVVTYLCNDHIFTCDFCNEMHPYSLNYSINGGDSVICDNCFDEYGATCDNCGDPFDREGCTWIDCDEVYYCESCIHRQSRYTFCNYCGEWEFDLCDSNYDPDDVQRWSTPNGMILDYSFKPRVEHFFLGSNDSDEVKTLFGFELEVESEGNSIQAGIDAVNAGLGEFVYLKSDGSLNRGFEIVSHPFSFNYYQEIIDFSFLKALQELGYRSWSAGTCGFHIHISRAGFNSAGHIWKFANLILGNARQWQKLAGRSGSRWASFELSDNNTMKVLKGEVHPHKYTAVNLSPRDTIEVRIFRGSLNERRLRSAIESVYLAMEYTRNLSVHEINQGGLSWSNFMEYTNKLQNNFGSFLNLGVELGIIPNNSPVEFEIQTNVDMKGSN